MAAYSSFWIVTSAGQAEQLDHRESIVKGMGLRCLGVWWCVTSMGVSNEIVIQAYKAKNRYQIDSMYLNEWYQGCLMPACYKPFI